MQNNTINLSVILPAFNEENYIEECILKLQAQLNTLNISYEIIVVDDGSVDCTKQKADQHVSEQIMVMSFPNNRGKGQAIKTGMMSATGAYRLFMDVDLSTSLNEIEKFFLAIQKDGNDVVIGTRKKEPYLLKSRQPFTRRFCGRVFTILSRFFTQTEFSDFTCGFKMFSQKAAEIIFSRQRVQGWAFDSELMLIAAKHNLQICELSVEWSNNKDSKVRLLKDIVSSVLGLIAMRINAWRGIYV